MSNAKIAVGKKVPDFKAESTSGSWRLKDALGKHVVLYFYPRDNTSGCTKEGEAFRDDHAAYRRANAIVVGVSTDSLASHEKFRAKYEFPFDLLADTDESLCTLFDVIKEKSMYG